MADDLSSKAKDSMWPTAQAAGNMLSSNKAAMTAPGTESVTPMPNLGDQLDPEVRPENYDGRHLVHGDGSQDGASWNDVSGSRKSWEP